MNLMQEQLEVLIDKERMVTEYGIQVSGVAGVGGILLDPGGQIELDFAWGLGNKTNNEAEWLALLQGLQFLHSQNYRKVLIFGDSKHVISKMINGYPMGAVNCRRLYKKEKLLMHKSYKPLHILRINNSAADIMANLGASLPQGHYRQNGNSITHKHIP